MEVGVESRPVLFNSVKIAGFYFRFGFDLWLLSLLGGRGGIVKLLKGERVLLDEKLRLGKGLEEWLRGLLFRMRPLG